MELRDGMLGVVIIAVAIAVALFGSYLAGVTSHEEEVINYKYLADVSGEFSYDQSPQYIDFDPSSNYTGYYSNNSKKPYEAGYYFAEDEVSYTPYTDSYGNVLVNNYKVDLRPEREELGTVDVSDCESTFHDGNLKATRTFYYNYNTTDGENVEKVAETDTPLGYQGNMGVTSLGEFLDYMGLHESGQYILKATGTPSDGNSNDEETFDSNWLLFTDNGMWEVDDPTILPDERYFYRCASASYNAKNNTNYPLPQIACKMDVKVTEIIESDVVVGYNYTGMVYLYTDAEFKNMTGYITLESCLVCYGTDTSSSDDAINFAQSCDYIFQIPRTSYLNPIYGVSLTDEA